MSLTRYYFASFRMTVEKSLFDILVHPMLLNMTYFPNMDKDSKWKNDSLS